MQTQNSNSKERTESTETDTDAANAWTGPGLAFRGHYLRRCTGCGAQVADTATVCNNCGEREPVAGKTNGSVNGGVSA